MAQYYDDQYDLGLEEEYDIDTFQNNEILLSQDGLYQVFLNRLEKMKEKLGVKDSSMILNILIFFNFEVEKIYDQLLFNADSEIIKLQLQEQGIYSVSEVHFYDNMLCSKCQELGTQGFSLDCDHKFCKNCWNQMIEVQFVDQIPLVKCLEDQCIVRLPHSFLEQYPQYQQIIIKRFMQHDNAITWCPGLNCENVFKCLTFTSTIKCPCNIKFCSKCREEKHHPIPCDIIKKVLDYQQSGEYWAMLHASKCPQCGRLIEKTDDRLCFKCLCGQHFCYICSGPWEMDHEASFSVCPYTNTNKNLSRYAQQLKNELQSITQNIQQIEASIKNLQQNIKNVQIDHLVEQSKKTISLLKTSRSFLYYKFFLMKYKGYDPIYELTFKQFQNELYNLVAIISVKKLEVEANEQSENKKNLGSIIFGEKEKKILSNLKIQKKHIKNYIKESLMM